MAEPTFLVARHTSYPWALNTDCSNAIGIFIVKWPGEKYAVLVE